MQFFLLAVLEIESEALVSPSCKELIQIVNNLGHQVKNIRPIVRNICRAVWRRLLTAVSLIVNYLKG